MRPASGGVDAGRCSECGLEFSWAALVEGVRGAVPSFIEHATGVGSVFFAFWRTWFWLLVPPRFYRRVRIEKRVHMARAWVWLILLLMMARSSEVALLIALTALNRLFVVPRKPVVDWNVIQAAATYRSEAWRRPIPIAEALLIVSALCAVTLAAVPETRRKAKVRFTLVARAWIYSHALLAFWWWLCLIEATWSASRVLLTGGVSQWSRWIDTFNYGSGPLLDARADAVLLLCLGWQLWYWHTATSAGLRIPRAWQITLAMAIISIIGTMALLGFLEPATIRDLLRIKA